ncbi:uncharacterized protein LOC106012701 [Aplysia californica]|uniref:Uncharacterized protein LOC106012701 n=1 Tax=Aplysia californica TaxID=6500 RepID=A0ABM1A6Q0_APLCA|nr:uncharacterized protein LOC106012701 [Aplysia californica]
MVYKVVLCTLLCLAVAANALVGKECESESDCGAGECCQILSEFMVVSRRAVELPPPEILMPGSTKGTCQMYRVEGQGCDSLAKINGYCGCGPGLYCNVYEAPLPTTAKHAPPLTRRDMRPSRPGYHWVSQCDKTNSTTKQP